MSQAAVIGMTAVTAVLMSWMLTRLVMAKVKIMDDPNHRSSHKVSTPRSGGIAIVVTFFLSLLALAALDVPLPWEARHFSGVIAAAFAIGIFSIIDDLKELGFKIKLLGQIVAALVVMNMGGVVQVIAVPGFGLVDLGMWSWAVTLLWIVGLTNAFNFMDGLDAMAGGVGAVVALGFAGILLASGGSHVHVLAIMTAAAIFGFLIWNKPPARIFMGDSGSQFLGFLFAVLAVEAARYDTAQLSFLIMPVLFFHFIWDTAFTMVRRWRAGERITQAHRGHIYQLLHRTGWSHAQVSGLYMGLTVLQALGAWVLTQYPGMGLWVFVPFSVMMTWLTTFAVSRARKAGLFEGEG